MVSQLSTWIGGIAAFLPLGYAFGTGMVSAVNPCGFALLPAYLGLFLGTGTLSHAPASAELAPVSTGVVAIQLGRAAAISGAMTLGFVLLFGSAGAVLAVGGQFLVRLVPWVAVVIGVGLVGLGLAMFWGKHPAAGVAARLAARLGDPRGASAWTFFNFGLAYALASLSCTLPIFLTVVGTSLTVGGFAQGTLQFTLYALGMGLVILALTVSIAVFKGVMVGLLRRVTPYLESVSAVLLIAAGSYVVYYWLFKGGLIRTLT